MWCVYFCPFAQPTKPERVFELKPRLASCLFAGARVAGNLAPGLEGAKSRVCCATLSSRAQDPNLPVIHHVPSSNVAKPQQQPVQLGNRWHTTRHPATLGSSMGDQEDPLHEIHSPQPKMHARAEIFLSPWFVHVRYTDQYFISSSVYCMSRLPTDVPELARLFPRPAQNEANTTYLLAAATDGHRFGDIALGSGNHMVSNPPRS